MATAVTLPSASRLNELIEAGRERPGMSAAMLNVVVFLDDPSSVKRIVERLRSFAHRHPCRTIVVDASRTGEPRVTGEEILLSVGGCDERRLRSLVHELLIPNVISALFWAGRDLRDARFDALSQLAATLVVDSSRAADRKASLSALTAMEPAQSRVRDLSYMRLLPWQDMIAQFFDDAELAEQLPTIANVSIASGSEPEAYYLAGWLASRLRWQPCGRNELCNPQGDTITVRFEQRGSARRVHSVVLEGRDATFSAELDLDSPDLVCLTVTGKRSRARRCAPLHDVDLVSLVEQAMLLPQPDALFVEALKMAAAILERSP